MPRFIDLHLRDDGAAFFVVVGQSLQMPSQM
jgi:hypothetical protein